MRIHHTDHIGACNLRRKGSPSARIGAIGSLQLQERKSG